MTKLSSEERRECCALLSCRSGRKGRSIHHFRKDYRKALNVISLCLATPPRPPAAVLPTSASQTPGRHAPTRVISVLVLVLAGRRPQLRLPGGRVSPCCAHRPPISFMFLFSKLLKITHRFPKQSASLIDQTAGEPPSAINLSSACLHVIHQIKQLARGSSWRPERCGRCAERSARTERRRRKLRRRKLTKRTSGRKIFFKGREGDRRRIYSI